MAISHGHDPSDTIHLLWPWAGCLKCEEHFPFDEALEGQDTQIPCPHCGQAIETFPAPKGVQQELPVVVQLVGAHREGPEFSGVSLDTNEQNLRPVMLNCPY